MYGITSPANKSESLDVVDGSEESVLDQTSLNIEDDADANIDIDHLFGEIDERENQTRKKNNSRNPFSKTSIVNKSQLTPLCGALAKIAKLSTPINESNGEVSRYGC